MSGFINEKICPFCQIDNRCGVNSASICWCHEVEVPEGLINLLAVEVKDKSCICSSCIDAYKNNTQLFKEKIPASNFTF
jgi:hypothetical protein